ncbi:MAG: hypothetical protein HY231_05390 [Acidobacteria bacterium]|nr:hypothetical protein [Acidobacteriota bacterium]
MKLPFDLYTIREILASRQTLRASLRDLKLATNGCETGVYIDETINWLCRAQDQVKGGGVSYGYDLRSGWLPPYPETTGYIIPTFLNYARRCEADGRAARANLMRERARRMADWLTTVQMESGAVQGGTLGTNPQPTIFNTGQVLQGWCHAYRESHDDALLDSLRRAAQWLTEVQDEDGCWRRFMSPLTLQTPATYNVRSASALLEAGELLADERVKRAAIRNFDWALTQQRANGWFDNKCLTDNTKPLTHTIGYTLEGFLDAAMMLQEERYLNAVLLTSEHLLNHVEADGFLRGRFDADWKPQVSWNCLTGACQIAYVWIRLSKLTGKREYVEAAQKLLGFVKRTQVCLTATDDPICGGIKGSHPVWGGYDPFRYPNWAAKFYVDALLALDLTS